MLLIVACMHIYVVMCFILMLLIKHEIMQSIVKIGSSNHFAG